MMVKRLDWENTAKRDDTIQQTAQILQGGGLCAIPSETVYELVADLGNEAAVSKLTAKISEMPVVLAPHRDAVTALLQKIDPVTRRLMDRCWPGPLSLALDYTDAIADKLAMAASAREQFASAGLIPFRVAGLPIAVETMRNLGGNLLAFDNPADGVLLDPDSIETRFGTVVDQIIQLGAVKFPQVATIVRVVNGDLKIIREGVLSLTRLRRLGSQVVVFVCTGNTCRSPMAEAIFKRILADKLNCDPQDLPDRGYTIVSAGVAALGGQPAAEEAVLAVRKYGGSLEDHVSQGLTPELIRLADRLIVMTHQHKVAIEDRWPNAASKTIMLSKNHDISDPIGLPLDQYEATAEQIEHSLRGLVEETINAA